MHLLVLATALAFLELLRRNNSTALQARRSEHAFPRSWWSVDLIEASTVPTSLEPRSLFYLSPLSLVSCSPFGFINNASVLNHCADRWPTSKFCSRRLSKERRDPEYLSDLILRHR